LAYSITRPENPIISAPLVGTVRYRGRFVSTQFGTSAQASATIVADFDIAACCRGIGRGEEQAELPRKNPVGMPDTAVTKVDVFTVFLPRFLRRFCGETRRSAAFAERFRALASRGRAGSGPNLGN
jgi:hypothetical protein